MDVVAIADISQSKLDEIIRSLPHKPRYVNDTAKTILDLSRMIRDEFGGRAQKMWQGRSPQQLKRDLRTIRGVGPHIASMTVNLVIRRYGDVFSRNDLNTVDIKADIHTCRVLYRLGLAAEDSDTAALEAARRLNPPYPGGLDAPLWWVGRRSSACSRPWTGAPPSGGAITPSSSARHLRLASSRSRPPDLGRHRLEA